MRSQRETLPRKTHTWVTVLKKKKPLLPGMVEWGYIPPLALLQHVMSACRCKEDAKYLEQGERLTWKSGYSLQRETSKYSEWFVEMPLEARGQCLCPSQLPDPLFCVGQNFSLTWSLEGWLNWPTSAPGSSCLCLFSTRTASIRFLCEHWGLKMDGYPWMYSK